MSLRTVREQDTVWEARGGRPLPEAPISNGIDATYVRPLGERRYIFGRAFPKDYEDVDSNNYKLTADHVWMPPCVQEACELLGRVIGRGHVSGLRDAALFMAAGRYGDARIGSISSCRARSALNRHGFPHPDLSDHCPMQFADLLTRPTDRGETMRALRSHRRHRVPVVLSLAQHGPDRPRHPVGERDRNQHPRLARQHPGQPGAFRHAEARGGLDH